MAEFVPHIHIKEEVIYCIKRKDKDEEGLFFRSPASMMALAFPFKAPLPRFSVCSGHCCVEHHFIGSIVFFVLPRQKVFPSVWRGGLHKPLSILHS